ncbi:hypothetical protein Hanom_Chr13g01182871 [Helianthus anomalus]
MILSFVVVADNYSPVKQPDIGGTAFCSVACGGSDRRIAILITWKHFEYSVEILMAYPDCDEQKLSETKMVLMNS